jgi:hypothetical protein
MLDRPVTVVELGSFLRSSAIAGLGDAERAELVNFLARNALSGVLIQGTGGLRKLRWARPGFGKSGGYRTIYYFHDLEAPLYAVLVYGKGKQADLTPEQRKSASTMVAEIKQTIRNSRGRYSKK